MAAAKQSGKAWDVIRNSVEVLGNSVPPKHTWEVKNASKARAAMIRAHIEEISLALDVIESEAE